MKSFLQVAEEITQEKEEINNVNSSLKDKKLLHSIQTQSLAQKVQKPNKELTKSVTNGENYETNPSDIESKSIVEKLKTVSSPIISPEKHDVNNGKLFGV